MSNLLNFIWLFSCFPHDIFVFCDAAHEAHHIVQYCLKWFNKHFVLRRSVIFTSLSAANDFADQFNSLHASFYFTARWLRYCSSTVVAEGDRKSCVPSFPENQIP